MAEQVPDVAAMLPEEAEIYARLCREPDRRCPTCTLVKPAVAFFVYHPSSRDASWWKESRHCQSCDQARYPTCCMCAQKQPPKQFMHVLKYSVGLDGRGAAPCCRSCTNAFLALPESQRREHIRSHLDVLYPAKAVIYALLDPRTQEVRYIGRTGNLKQRYQDHLKGRIAPPGTDVRGAESSSKRNWIYDLLSLGLKPIPAILQVVETGPLVVEWEGRYVAHGIQQGWPLLNVEVADEKFVAQIEAHHLDFLHAPFQTIANVLARRCPQYHWFGSYGFAAFVRAWYVDERDILPEATEHIVPVPIQTAGKGKSALVTRSLATR